MAMEKSVFIRLMFICSEFEVMFVCFGKDIIFDKVVKIGVIIWFSLRKIIVIFL